jgi:hypothetical protein
MNLLPLLFANLTPPDTMISGDWMLKLVAALFTGAALVLGRYWGKKEASEMTINSPVPEVPTRKVSTPPSWDAHVALSDRVTRQELISNELRHDLSEVRKDMGVQYRELIKAGHDREQNLSDKLDGISRSIHARIDELMKPKTPR